MKFRTQRTDALLCIKIFSPKQADAGFSKVGRSKSALLVEHRRVRNNVR